MVALNPVLTRASSKLTSLEITCLISPLALLLLAAAPRTAQAQTSSVGIGTTAPDASAVLDVSSSTKGLLPHD